MSKEMAETRKKTTETQNKVAVGLIGNPNLDRVE
jgi:hypothetical protein